MKTLLITDLHFNNKIPGLLDAQVRCIKKIYDDIVDTQILTDIVIMGDLMMHRRPTASVLLALKSVVHHLSSRSVVHILRGNHDSESKSDDGVTALSLLSVPNMVRVYTQTEYKCWDNLNWSFIPHYEDQERITSSLVKVPEKNIVFGHFGYRGCLNSAGDQDFMIPKTAFKNPTFLGHIHKYKEDGNIIVLGTPYSTSFQEAGKESYYGILEDNKFEKHLVTHGPRHLVMRYGDLSENIDFINDENYFTMLRVVIDEIEVGHSITQFLYENIKVGYIELKYKPKFNEKYDIPDSTSTPVIEIDEELIGSYIEESKTTLNKEDLLNGLSLIKETVHRKDNE